MIKDDQVYVEDDKDEVDLKTANLMPTALSTKQLQQMHEQLAIIRNENDCLKRDWTIKEQ